MKTLQWKLNSNNFPRRKLSFGTYKKVTNKKFSISKRVKSFTHAFNGIVIFFKDGQNGLLHLLASLMALGLSFWLQIDAMEWVLISLAITLVFAAEIFNSAIEKLANALTTEIRPEIKIVKDLAAAAVLVTAIGALIIAFIIFLPKIIILINR